MVHFPSLGIFWQTIDHNLDDEWLPAFGSQQKIPAKCIFWPRWCHIPTHHFFSFYSNSRLNFYHLPARIMLIMYYELEYVGMQIRIWDFFSMLKSQGQICLLLLLSIKLFCAIPSFFFSSLMCVIVSARLWNFKDGGS